MSKSVKPSTRKRLLVEKLQQPKLKLKEDRAAPPTSSVDETVSRFFDDIEKIIGTALKTASPEKADLVGSRVFILTRTNSSPPYPVLQFSLAPAQNPEQRLRLITAFVQDVALNPGLTVLAFFLVAEAWAAVESVDALQVNLRPSQNPNRIEVLIMTAQDEKGNFRFKIDEIKRTPFGVTLEPHSMDVDGEKKVFSSNGWQKRTQSGLLEDGATAEDVLIDTAWREYTLARLLAGVEVNLN